jgi:Putative zinc-finger
MEHELAVRNRLAERYLLGELNAGDRDEFEAHYFDCVACARDVRDGAAFIANAKSVLREDLVSSRVASGRWDWTSWFRMPALVPSAAAATLAAVVAYQAAVVIPRLHSAAEPRLVAMTTLQPSTRGEPQLLRISRNDRFFSLTFDVNSRERFSSFESTVNRADGGVVAEATATGGDVNSLTLWLPSDRFENGEYVLTLRGISGTRRVDVDRFRFVVQKS